MQCRRSWRRLRGRPVRRAKEARLRANRRPPPRRSPLLRWTPRPAWPLQSIESWCPRHLTRQPAAARRPALGRRGAAPARRPSRWAPSPGAASGARRARRRSARKPRRRRACRPLRRAPRCGAARHRRRCLAAAARAARAAPPLRSLPQWWRWPLRRSSGAAQAALRVSPLPRGSAAEALQTVRCARCWPVCRVPTGAAASP
mmetsp:Transcript_59024/g.169479  ORF Transcript_59024/g.169479 Transcript_59024/m.169479 type:complete len:202 (-) Transcript_59024:359-964(-)